MGAAWLRSAADLACVRELRLGSALLGAHARADAGAVEPPATELRLGSALLGAPAPPVKLWRVVKLSDLEPRRPLSAVLGAPVIARRLEKLSFGSAVPGTPPIEEIEERLTKLSL